MSIAGQVRPREPRHLQGLRRFSQNPNIYNKPGNLLSLRRQVPRIEEMEFRHSFGTAEWGVRKNAIDRCVAFRYNQEFLECTAASAGIRRSGFLTPRLAPLRPLSVLVAQASELLIGAGPAAFEELSLPRDESIAERAFRHVTIEIYAEQCPGSGAGPSPSWSCGLFLVSDELDLEGVENGSYDYRHFWRVPRAVSDQAAAISRGNAQVNIAILSGAFRRVEPCRLREARLFLRQERPVWIPVEFLVNMEGHVKS